MARPFFFFGRKRLTILGKHVGVQIDYYPEGGIKYASPFWTKVMWTLLALFVGLLVYVEKFT